MDGNIVEKKSFKFAIRIVNLYKHLTADKKEYIMSKKLLKCGTSIGANVAEAECVADPTFCTLRFAFCI